MSIELMKKMVDELEYVLDCINQDKIPFDGDDFHEILRLGRKAITEAALEKKAENARELGLDYEPAQKPWLGLTEEDFVCVHQLCDTPIQAAEYVDFLLREKNA